jgi:Soluble NSF attachment protein, SNAP
MQSRCIIELQICLKWLKSGNKLELHSARLEIFMDKLEIVTMQPPTTSMHQIVTRRYENRKYFILISHFHFSHLQVDPNEAVTCLLKAIDIYTDMGRFTMAAKHHQSIAEMFENEANDLVSVCKLEN